MNFWEQPDWIKIKTFIAKTDKLLSRAEYLRLVGWENYSEDKYQTYLRIMKSDKG